MSFQSLVREFPVFNLDGKIKVKIAQFTTSKVISIIRKKVDHQFWKNPNVSQKII